MSVYGGLFGSVNRQDVGLKTSYQQGEKKTATLKLTEKMVCE
jgi:hypothetical protein